MADINVAKRVETVPKKPAIAPASAPPKRPISRATTASPAHHSRIVSLDALRGFDMFWIIGGQPLAIAALGLFPPSASHFVEQAKKQLDHAGWDGFRAWDLIMPLFLFVVGAAMPFSFSRRIEEGHSRAKMFRKILFRSVILFIVGMAYQGHLLDFNLNTLHIYANTLQAIAAGYLIAGILMLTVPVWAQIVTAIILLVAYWLLLMYVPVPGRGAGVIEEFANIAYTVDQWVLGRFIDGTKPPYTWVLSSMTFTATVLLGVFAGYVLRSRFSPIMKFVWLALLGAACLAGGWAWAEYLHFPIIKHIWTSSMVLWAAGWSFLLLALFYLVIDVVGFRIWAFPFIVIGMNAITAYVAYRFIPFRDIASGLVGGLASHLGSGKEFTIALTSALLVWLMLYHLYRHKIFLRI
jgi:predicted acyltransferase